MVWLIQPSGAVCKDTDTHFQFTHFHVFSIYAFPPNTTLRSIFRQMYEERLKPDKFRHSKWRIFGVCANWYKPIVKPFTSKHRDRPLRVSHFKLTCWLSCTNHLQISQKTFPFFFDHSATYFFQCISATCCIPGRIFLPLLSFFCQTFHVKPQFIFTKAVKKTTPMHFRENNLQPCHLAFAEEHERDNVRQKRFMRAPSVLHL